MTAIVWIRRSLREKDNTALIRAAEEHRKVIPFYIIDQNYFETQKPGYPRVKFWRDSLNELKQELLRHKSKDLVIRSGKPLNEIENLINETEADALYFNRDYTPYSRKRDKKIIEETDIPVKTFKDHVMFEKEEILTNEETPYKVFSYYKRKWFNKEKRRPEKPGDYTVPVLDSHPIPTLNELGIQKPDGLEEVWEGGRENGLERLEKFKNQIGAYKTERDYPAKDATSKLSPHIKFGTISVREIYWESERTRRDQAAEGIETWQEELAWRDFYYQLLWHNPRTVQEPFLEQYEDMGWRSKEEAGEDWERFIKGETGYPFVDAGMRQLRKTGWMHNRLRMVVTSFACKDLWLDWRDLHDYYKKMFVDADIASMIGGIQWAYSIGTDAQPYFRVFNPTSQGKKYDPDGEYIKKWVPELENVPDSYLHRPWRMPSYVQQNAGVNIGEDYPEPIVDHDKKRKEAVKKFEQANENQKN